MYKFKKKKEARLPPSPTSSSSLELGARRLCFSARRVPRVSDILAVLAVTPDAPQTLALLTRDDRALRIPLVHGDHERIVFLGRACLPTTDVALVTVDHQGGPGLVVQGLGGLRGIAKMKDQRG